MLSTYTCSSEEFLKNARVPLRILSEPDMYREMGRIMADVIKAKNGERTVIICPVGPILQYPEFVKIVNAERISLKNVWFFNMDEYLTDDDEMIAMDNPLSFRAIMDRLLYSQIDPELAPPPEQRNFPYPGHEREYDELIASLGGADCCLTGVGINGHIAFNEPPAPEDPITDEEFGEIGTRCLNISKETIVNNGANKIRGALDIFPRRCISLGMKSLLEARMFKVYLYCPWQWGIMRKMALEPMTRFAPVTYLQKHPNAEMVVTQELVDWRLGQ